MISSVRHDNVSRLVTDGPMYFAVALDQAFENIDCMSVILRCQAKNRFYGSTHPPIQSGRVLCISPFDGPRGNSIISNGYVYYWHLALFAAPQHSWSLLE
jgi:hypothetical protein